MAEPGLERGYVGYEACLLPTMSISVECALTLFHEDRIQLSYFVVRSKGRSNLGGLSVPDCLRKPCYLNFSERVPNVPGNIPEGRGVLG